MFALREFIKTRPLFSSVLLLVVLVACYFRLWNLPQTLHFMGDQGRDALVVSRIFTERDLIFIGPVTSVGNMYLGPFYYYFMLPFLYLSYPSPLGPAYAVAVVNVLGVLLTYVWGRKLIGEKAAFFAAAMMAISSVAIALSRFSWNPNIASFFALAMMVATYYAWKVNHKYWLLVGLCFGILLQLHYVTIMAGASSGLIFIWQLFEQRKNRKSLLKTLLSGLGAVTIVIVLLLPLLLFDLKHNWVNAAALQNILFHEEAFSHNSPSIQEELSSFWLQVKGRTFYITFDTLVGENRIVNTALLVSMIAIIVVHLKMTWKKAKANAGLVVVLSYLLVGILGFSVYEHEVYDHYISYLFPSLFLLVGFCLERVRRIKYIGWVLVIGFLAYYTNYNLRSISFDAGGPKQSQLQDTADSIHARVADNEPYSVVLLSESKDLYGMNYRYFLSTNPAKTPLDPDENVHAQKLFIINEEGKTNEPQYLPIYEIVMFENKEPVEVYSLPQGISVTVLAKNSSN